MSDQGQAQPSAATTTATTTTTTTISDLHWQEHAENLQYLWCSGGANGSPISVLPHPPTALKFSREFVSKSRPCIIRNVFVEKDGTTPKRLTLEDIILAKKKNKEAHKGASHDDLITVDVTPDGLGDCVRYHKSKRVELFVQPKECKMTISEFQSRLRQQQDQLQLLHNHTKELDAHGRPVLQLPEKEPSTSGKDEDNDDSQKGGKDCSSSQVPHDSVVYYSRQNDCLRTEFPELEALFPLEALAWAQDAFGTELDAVNLWIGNEAAVSSMHKDHYENLFYVCSGEKIFTLCPPACVPFLYEHLEYPTAVFDVVDNTDSQNDQPQQRHQWAIRRIFKEDCGEHVKVRWVAPDVISLMTTTTSHNSGQTDLPRLSERYPLLQHVHPIEVRVQAGDLLYLPSLWFHRVTQSEETVGVNFWYDMHFDSPLWCYYSLLSQLEPESNHQ